VSGAEGAAEPSAAEDDLVRALMGGDREALHAVYTRHAEHVRAFARRFLGDDAAAEDLLHDVFVALPGAIRRWRGDCALRTYLVSVAANTSRHALRSSIRRRSAMGRLAVEPPPSSPNLDHALERRRLADALTRALDELPHDQRLAFVLCEVEERTSKEVAVIVGSNETTVRTRLHHAKKKLRASLEKEGVR
jgi:RNA polymerase sigma-70 factor (ECF subfamily)